MHDGDCGLFTFATLYTMWSYGSYSFNNFFPILRLSNPRVAVALSDQSCAIYDVTQLTKVQALCGHKKRVVNVR
jgi:hypothetical protein